jgi:ribosomal protein S11
MALVEPATNRDPSGTRSWGIDDVVVRLRLWGTEYTHPLPEPCVLRLGSGSGCDVRLHDETGRLSREHAMLVPEPGGWQIRDLDSKNGLWVEGSRTTASTLHAGARIRLGGLTLVAESLGFIKLRSLACRLMGWASERQGAIDEALQNLRDGAMQRMPVALIGEANLAPLASRLHRMTLGPDAPFVSYDGGDVAAAIRTAMRGTLCVANRRRATASAIADAVRATEIAMRPRLMLCASTIVRAAAVGAKPGRLAMIAIPSLSARGDEITRLIHETAQTIVEEMGAPSSGFTMHDLERLTAIKFSGIAKLEDSIRRIVAARTWGVTMGAKRLGLKHSSLSQWARNKKRRLST